MKVKTSDLFGVALDWAVTKAEGLDASIEPGEAWGCWNWAFDWGQAGPIIEREKIELIPKGTHWDAFADEDCHVPYSGPTPLIAAMRCYVASQLGDEVELPDELWEGLK